MIDPFDWRRCGIASVICRQWSTLELVITSGMLAKTLILKHSFQPDAVAFSILLTGSRVPAFKMIESRRPNVFNVSAMPVFAVPS